MVRNLHLLLTVSVLGLAAGLAGAQAPCNPNPQPNGLDLKDLSRNIFGAATVDAKTVVYFSICQTTGCVTRTTYNQPFRMVMPRNACDEVPQLEAVLDGRYFSVRRMNDPHPNLDPTTDPNPRIGYEYVKGNILSPTGAAPIGTFEMNGVIATNTCRPPLPDGIGRCYDCAHHEGYITMTFTSGPLAGRSGVFAEYHFHQETMEERCDYDDPCHIEFQYWGALDGIFLSRCPVAGIGANSLRGGNSTGTLAQ